MHYTIDSPDVPPPVVVFERREQPDRRTIWRGGRRNTDWINRPIGAWEHFAHRQSLWRYKLSRLAARVFEPVSVLLFQVFR